MPKQLAEITQPQIDAMRAYHARRDALRRERLEQAEAAIREIAPRHPAVAAVYLFGSILSPGRFSQRSDVDVAVVCDDLEAESRFWSEMDRALGGAVDLRPLEGAVVRAVDNRGELVYEREVSDPRA